MSGYSGKSAVADAVRLRGGVSRRRRVLRGARVLHGAADQGARPVSVFGADSACYHVGVGECLRPRLAYRRYLSFSVCMCFCLLADVNLDQTMWAGKRMHFHWIFQLKGRDCCGGEWWGLGVGHEAFGASANAGDE